MAEESDVLFREIEDDLRQDQANKLWTNYGKYFVGAAIAVVAGVAAFQGWQTYDLNNRQAAGETFAAAQKLIEENKTEEALDAFSKISSEGTGYALLAKFRAAALKSEAGDVAGAVADYATLADDTSASSYYKNMAIILGAFAELDSGASGSSLIGRVSELNDATNPWRHSAREILGLDALNKGETSKAAEFFKAIADDATAPQTVKARTGEMLKIIGG